MNIIEVHSLAIPEIQVIRFGRFPDHRGYFAEHFRTSGFHAHPDLAWSQNVDFVQCNESYSKPGTIRGLHFQWNPYMGKLVRTVRGRMIDMVLDIRKGSPSWGQILLYDMPADPAMDYQEWIWVPPGFAHGNCFPEETMIEYFCTGRYSPGCEAGICPMAKDIDWSMCDADLKSVFDLCASSTPLISDKDKNGFTLQEWLKHEHADKFVYTKR